MEKSFIQSEKQQPAPQSLTTAVHRKPVATSATSPDVKSEPPIYIEVVPQPERNYSPPTKIPSTNDLYNSPLPPPPPTPSQSRSQYTSAVKRLRARYTTLPKRTRYILLGSLLVLVSLIIGLAAGLSSRNTHFKNLPLPTTHGGPYTGDLTYYDPALGACGYTSTSADYIVAVSHLVFDAAATVTGETNPNANPLCGKMIRARRGDRSVDLRVVDRCTGCQSTDLDVSRTVFAGLATLDLGRVGVSWAWLEDVST